MLNPFQRLTSHWRQSASARPPHGRRAATLGVERLELRNLLSASSLVAPNGDAPHFEDALYDHPAALASQSQDGPAQNGHAHDAASWGNHQSNGYEQQNAHAQQRGALGSVADEASRRPAYATANTRFVYIITITWYAPLAESVPPPPGGFSEDFGDIAELPKSSGSSRPPVASKAAPESPNNSSTSPATDLLGDVLDTVRQSKSTGAIATFATTPLAETQTSAKRFSATLRAHDIVFQTLTSSAVARRQDIETWALASAEESRWARTEAQRETESIASEDNADAQFELTSLGTLRRVTDNQADELAGLLDRLETQAPAAWRRASPGRASAPAGEALVDAIQQAGAAQQATIDDAGGMILLRATRGANGEVIDALDAALAIDDLDDFLTGKFDDAMPVTTASVKVSSRPRDARTQTAADSPASSSRSETPSSTSSSILPVAAAGMGAMVIAARGGRWRDWLRNRRTHAVPATPK